MNDRSPFLKDSILSEFLIFQCNLFHSFIAKGKIAVLKSSVLHLLLEFITFPCSMRHIV